MYYYNIYIFLLIIFYFTSINIFYITNIYIENQLVPTLEGG